MGVFRDFYLVDGHPVFLTFSRYASIMKLMQKTGKISLEDAEKSDEFWNTKSQKRTVKAIEQYLSEVKKSDPTAFEQEWLFFNETGKESQDNVSALLSGICKYYKTFHIDAGFSADDMVYPFGKFFYFGASGKEKVLEVLINTSEVDYIAGNIQFMLIGFRTGGGICIEDGHGIILSDNISGEYDLAELRSQCEERCITKYYQKSSKFWFFRKYK